MKTQQTLTKFLGLSSSSSSSIYDNGSDKGSDEPKTTPQYWTGVKHRSKLSAPNVAVFDIIKDVEALTQENVYTQVLPTVSKTFLFNTDDFGLNDPDLVPENHALSDD